VAWVVKTWRIDPVAAAERDARRVTRLARREVADAEAHLLVLEELGQELLAGVERRRRPAERPEPAFKRSSLRDSPLAGLFQSTGGS
jgi:hypothetical protein